MAFSKLRLLRPKKPAAEVRLGARPAVMSMQMPGAEVLAGARLAALSRQTPAADHNDNDDSYDEDGDYKMKDLPDERPRGEIERAMEKTAAMNTKREAPESIK